MKKYELVKSDTVNYKGKTLYRIKYLIDIPRHNIKAGDLGGFLESENNLSHDGDCVVLDDAAVSGDALVYGNAKVSDNARVCGNVRVSGDAAVFGNARVFGNACVYGNAKVNSGKHKDMYIAEDLVVRSLPLWKVLYR
jgi:NDP-sugar pyrophosphorylase family protein